MEKFHILRENILVDKWYIPVKLDEALGLCLTAAIHLAEEGTLVFALFTRRLQRHVVPYRETGWPCRM